MLNEIYLVCALGLLLVAVLGLVRLDRRRTWQLGRARILRAEVQLLSLETALMYVTRIHYVIDVDGRRIEASDHLGKAWFRAASAEAMVGRYQSGQEVCIVFDPRCPDESRLTPGSA
jgi:Protein of unknown function (DUF3592)